MKNPRDQSPAVLTVYRISLGLFVSTHCLCWLLLASPFTEPRHTPLSIARVLVIAGALAFAAWPKLWRFLSLPLVVGWAAIFYLDPLLMSSEVPLIGWMLLVAGLMTCDRQGRPVLQNWLWSAAWLVLSITYLHTGLTKLQDPSWVTGDTLSVVLNSNLCYWPGLGGLARNLAFLKYASFAVIGLQIVSPLLLFTAGSRRVLWYSQVSFHLLTLALLRVDQVTWAFLTMHLFIFDRELLPRSLAFARTRETTAES